MANNQLYIDLGIDVGEVNRRENLNQRDFKKPDRVAITFQFRRAIRGIDCIKENLELVNQRLNQATATIALKDIEYDTLKEHHETALKSLKEQKEIEIRNVESQKNFEIERLKKIIESLSTEKDYINEKLNEKIVATRKKMAELEDENKKLEDVIQELEHVSLSNAGSDTKTEPNTEDIVPETSANGPPKPKSPATPIINEFEKDN